MKDCCATCRYWATEDRKTGLCRRFPPRPIMLGMGQPSVLTDPARAAPQPIIMSYYPNMMEHGWCGEHTPKLAS